MGISSAASAPARQQSSTAVSTRHPGRSGKSGFPPAYRKMSPVRRLEWLASAEVEFLIACGDLQGHQVANEQRRLEKQKQSVRMMAPTPACVDDFMAGQAFPPKADSTACRMRRADYVVDEASERKVHWPPYYLTGVPGKSPEVIETMTYELQLVINRAGRDSQGDADRERGIHTTESPSAASIQAAETARAEIVSTMKDTFKLAAEDEAELRKEIARYLALAGGEVRKIVV